MPAGFLFLFLLLMVAGLAIAVLSAIFVAGIISGAHGVPYVFIRQRYVRPLLFWAGLTAEDTFYDLGCGDGRVLISAVKDFRVKKTVGYEVALWPYLEARFVIWSSGASGCATVHNQNFFKADLSDASFVYMYLFPKVIDQLAFKMASELRAGARILCPAFPIDLTRHPEFKLLKSEKIAKITAYLYERV